MGWEERKASEVMSSPVKCVELGDTLEEVVQLLADEGVTGALVTDRRGKPVGVVSHADIVTFIAGLERSLALGGFYFMAEARDDVVSSGPAITLSPQVEDALKETVVDAIMTPEVIAVPSTAPLSAVAEAMVTRRVHRLLIEEDGAVIGIVSTLDVLRAMTGRTPKAAPAKKAPKKKAPAAVARKAPRRRKAGARP